MLTPTVAPAQAAHPLEQLAVSAIDASPYVRGGRVRIEAGEDAVRLHGNVGTFFEKQMAQEALLRVDGIERVENLLQVAWT